MRRIAPARLDPVGRLRLPRRSTLLRLALVAALLLTAAGVLYADPAPVERAATPPPSSPPAPTPSPDPAEPDPAARLPIPDGLVGVPVPLSDPTSLTVLDPGDRVDLFAVPAAGGEPAALAGDAPVLAVDRGSAALLLALTPAQGRAVVATPATTGFAVIVR